MTIDRRNFMGMMLASSAIMTLPDKTFFGRTRTVDQIKVIARFVSAPGSDLMQTQHLEEKRLSNETWEQYDGRIWTKKVHVDIKTGQVFLPPFALKNALESAGKWLSEKIEGEGKKTYTDRFRKGVLVTERMLLETGGKPITIDDVQPNTILVPSTGKRGTGSRVARVFPTITEWETTASIWILDSKISESVLLRHLEAIGQFIGFGAMRVENGGANGRFLVSDLKFGV